MYSIISFFESKGPSRFLVLMGAWSLLILSSLYVSQSNGGNYDLTRFGCGVLITFGPFVLKTLSELAWCSLLEATADSMSFFLTTSYERINFILNAEIWIGRVAIVLGMTISLIALFA